MADILVRSQPKIYFHMVGNRTKGNEQQLRSCLLRVSGLHLCNFYEFSLQNEYDLDDGCAVSKFPGLNQKSGLGVA